MPITNAVSGTRIDEVAEKIYRISTPLSPEKMPGGFSFNQYLLDDEEPLLFHTGGRGLFPLVAEAVGSVLPVEKLRWIGFSHLESDECGALNQFLSAAPKATPLCSRVAALVSMNDLADRAPKGLADGETFSTGSRTLEWIDAPHLPHGWETGYLMDKTASALFCGDLFTQPGHNTPAMTSGDILGPSEAFRHKMDYWAHARDSAKLFQKLIDRAPKTLLCMHGSAWSGDGGKLLSELRTQVSGA